MTFSHSHLPPYWKYSRAHAYNHILLLGQHDKHTSELGDVVQISTKDLIPWKPKAIHITERTHEHIILIWVVPDTRPVAVKHYEVQKWVRGGGWTEVGCYNNICAIVHGLQTGTSIRKFHVCALNAKLNPGEHTATEDCTLDLTPGQLQPPSWGAGKIA